MSATTPATPSGSKGNTNESAHRETKPKTQPKDIPTLRYAKFDGEHFGGGSASTIASSILDSMQDDSNPIEPGDDSGFIGSTRSRDGSNPTDFTTPKDDSKPFDSTRPSGTYNYSGRQTPDSERSNEDESDSADRPDENGEDTPDISSPITHAKDEITIVLAGKSGAGKSTLVNNIFGLTIDTRMSANSSTKELSTYSVINHDTTIKIIDTIGFSLNSKKPLEEISKHTHGKADLVLYCLPIGPGLRFADFNPDIMRSLTGAFRKDIWRHCMVVLTYSNLAWDRIKLTQESKEAAINEYKAYIAEYVENFKQELTNLNVRDVDVKSVFDIKSANAAKRTIVFIPAGYNPDDQVLPGLDYKVKTSIAPAADTNSNSSDDISDDQETRVRSKPRREDQPHSPEDQMQPHPREDTGEANPLQEIEVCTHQWKDVLVLEMIGRSDRACNLALLRFWYPRALIKKAFKGHGINLRVSHSIGGGMSGGVVGGFVGGGTGFVLGGVGGPVGMGVGLTLGVLTGIIAGTLVGGGGGAALSHSLAVAKEEEKEANESEEQKEANEREEEKKANEREEAANEREEQKEENEREDKRKEQKE